MSEIIIIGGGVAGLAAGISVLIGGEHATVIEKQNNAGGNLTGWSREGYHIDNCIHWLTGTNPDTELYSIWKTLGVFDNTGVYAPQSLYTFEKNGKHISLCRDAEELRETMLSLSPADEKEIDSFIKAVRAVMYIDGLCGDAGDFREKIRTYPSLIKYFSLTTGELSRRFSSELLQGFLCSIMGEEFGALALVTVFATFCGKNGDIPVGGSRAMAERMRARFEALGGTLRCGCEVTKINLDEYGCAESVTLSGGETAYADYVIIAIDPAVAFGRLLDADLMPRTLKNLYANPKMRRFSSYHCALACETRDMPFSHDVIFEIPKEKRGIFSSKYMILREFSHEKRFAPAGKNIIQSMVYCSEEKALDFIAISENEKVYAEKKQMLAEETRELSETEFPSLKGKLRCIDVWTPATYHRCVGSEIGSFMGFAFPKLAVPKKLPCRIKGLENVFLGTQWLSSPGGLPNAARAGIAAAETILKLEKSPLGERKLYFGEQRI